MNSGGLEVSILSWMCKLSTYFECVFVLTYVSYSTKILLERGIYVI